MPWIRVLTFIFLAVPMLEAIEWVQEPQNKEILPGGRVVLACQVSGEYQSINWLGKTSALDTELIFIKNGRDGAVQGWKPLEGFKIQNAFDLVIESASYASNNGDYRCTAKTLDDTEVRTATVTVLRAPTPPTFSVTSGGISDVKGPYVAGNTYEIVCASKQGNPKPRIAWTMNGNEIADKASGNDLTLTRVFSKEDHQAKFACSVKNNAINDPKVTDFTANVEYTPVLRADNEHRVIEGKDASLTCSVDANPPVGDNVEWLKKDGLISKATNPILYLANVAQSDAGAYLCRATNTRGRGETEVELDVLYPPKITLPGKGVFNEGDPVSVECVVDSNPVPVKIIWLKSKVAVSTGPWLNFTAIDRKNASFYECSSSNKMNPTIGIVQDTATEKSTEVVVNYKPGPATVSGSPDVTEGSGIDLTCTLPDAGIPEGTFKWQMKNAAGVVKELVQVSSRLTVNSARREDEGTYICWGTNSIGNGEKGELNVIVNVKPVIDGTSWKPTTDVKEDAVQNLECIAEGKPIPTITWKKDGEIISEIIGGNIFTIDVEDPGSEKRKSTIRFKGAGRSPKDTKVEPSDYGRYECVASNAGGETIASTNVRILYKPRMRTTQLKFASRPSDDVDLSCVAEAFPLPAFEWNRNNVKISNGSRFSILAPQQVQGEAYPFVYKSVLKISSVEESDYGAYQCVSGNDDGLSDVNVTLDKLSKPDAPTKMEFGGKKYNSVTLSWLSGFNGGKEQTFTLLLTKDDASVARRKRTALGEEIVTGVVGVNDPPGTRFEYNITGLEPSQLYNVALEAKNMLGGSGYARRSFTTAKFPVEPDMVPKINKVEIFDNVLTASVNMTNVDEFDLCMKVETTTGEPKDYKPLQDCGGLADKYQLPAEARKVRVSVCVAERQSVCSLAEERDLTPPTPWWIWLLVAVGILLFLILLVLLILCCRRRCREGEGDSEEEKAKMNGSPPDYDNDTAHRKRHPHPYAADNPAHDIDFADPKLHGVYANNIQPVMTTDLPDGPYIAKPVNVIDHTGNGVGQFPPYWPSSNGTMQRPLSSYNPYITSPHLHQQPQHGTFRSGGGPHQNPALMGGPAHQSPYILDYDDDAKKPDGYDSGYSAEDHPVAAPQRQPTQKSGGKRTIYEVVV